VSFDISHAVDDSDIVFCLRLDRASTICSMLGSKGAARHRVSTSLDAFINLPTLNYLLAGLQLCYVPTHPEKSKWSELLHDLDQHRYTGPGQHLGLDDVRYIVRDLIRPFGVMRGSEKQGGQDETGLASATWPVNFVANLVLDGKERNIVNVWHNHDISAGDDLVLRLKPMPIPSDREGGYTLNHYYKRYVQQNFASYFQTTLGRAHATHVWQLVPDIFSLDYEPENDVTHGAFAGPGIPREPLPHVVMSPGFEVPRDYVWQELGFWHIGRSQVMVRRFAHTEYYYNDMANNLKINHLDMTFEPTWTKVPGEERNSANPRSVRDPDPARGGRGVDRINVLPGMMGEEYGGDDGRSKRVRWAPSLRLEQFLREPMPEFEEMTVGAPAGTAAAPGAQPDGGQQHQTVLRLFAPPSAPSHDSVARMFATPRAPSSQGEPGVAADRMFAPPARAPRAPPQAPPIGSRVATNFEAPIGSRLKTNFEAPIGSRVTAFEPPPAPPRDDDVGMGSSAPIMDDADDGLSPLLSSLPTGAPLAGDSDSSSSSDEGDGLGSKAAAGPPAAASSSRPPPKGLGALFSSRGRGGGAKKKPGPAGAGGGALP